jgi:hypothetical protein
MLLLAALPLLFKGLGEGGTVSICSLCASPKANHGRDYFKVGSILEEWTPAAPHVFILLVCSR